MSLSCGLQRMKASEIVAELPEQPTPERESKIINFIGLGYYLEPKMIAVKSQVGDHEATLFVMSDALMLGEPDDFLRVNATMEGEQRIADLLQMTMLTSKVADLVRNAAAVQIEPQTQTPDAQMAYTSRMVKHSSAVTSAIMKVVPTDLATIANGDVGLVSDVGKDWVLSNKLYGRDDLAANYGWHTKQKPSSSSSGPYPCPGGGYMWQTLGTAHNPKHVDYSQVIRFMSTKAIVDGRRMDFIDLASDPDLCALVSYEGPLKVFRHPSYVNIGEVMNA